MADKYTIQRTIGQFEYVAMETDEPTKSKLSQFESIVYNLKHGKYKPTLPDEELDMSKPKEVK